MATRISDFDYHLPRELIAQTPASPRESARLMVLDKPSQSIRHAHVSDLPDYFHEGDVLVVNNTKVFHARLHGAIEGKPVQIFLVKPLEGTRWLTLGKPGKKITPGSSVTVGPGFTGSVTGKYPDGTLSIDFGLSPGATIDLANKYGEIPIPPYIKTMPTEKEYQTSYAKVTGSVAAPTAGFHFTTSIRRAISNKGVTILEVTLHVGLGTFLPIKTQTVEEHVMHSEWVDIPDSVASYITRAKQEKRRIIAAGTTTVRTLEGVARKFDGKLKGYKGEVNLFITPGFQFFIVDAMVTNFHLPKSSLLVLVSAFAGREFILSAYQQAVNTTYRFYSFGDAMLIAKRSP